MFKVGALKSARGNPDKELIDIQKVENKKEGNTLEEEIKVLQPDVAIFSTGSAYDKHIEDLLDRSTKDADPELKVAQIEDLGCLAYRTYHFQYYSNRKFKRVADYICDRVNGTVT